MILVIWIFFRPMVAILPASDASTISEKQHGFFPLSSSTLCNSLFLCTRFLLSTTHFDKIPQPAGETEKERQKIRKEEGGSQHQVDTQQCVSGVCLSESRRQTHMVKTLSSATVLVQ